MKKIFAIMLVTFIYGCGYTSIYQELKRDLYINIVSMKGDFEINNYLKNDLKMSSNKDSSNIYDLNIETDYNKIVLAKDATGNATDYNIEMSVKIIVVSNNNNNIVYKENFKIKKNDDNFEQSNYEREIKWNFSEIVKDKLVLYLLNLNDN